MWSEKMLDISLNKAKRGFALLGQAAKLSETQVVHLSGHQSQY